MKTQNDSPMCIVIFGNSGAGKSTFAQRIVKRHNIAHLDLDTLAWLPTEIPERAPIADSMHSVNAFINTQKKLGHRRLLRRSIGKYIESS